MSFASSLTSHLRRVPSPQEPTPGRGRHAIVSHVDRWFVATAADGTARTALLVIDVDIDDALPVVTRTPVLSAVGADGPGAWRAVRTSDARSSNADASDAGHARNTVGAANAVDAPMSAELHGEPADDEDPDAQRRARLGSSVARAIGTHVRPGDAVARIDAGRFAVLRGTLDDGVTARAQAAELARGIEDALVGRPEGFGVRVTAGAVTLKADAPREGRSALGAVTTAMLEGKLMTDDRVVVAVAPGG